MLCLLVLNVAAVDGSELLSVEQDERLMAPPGFPGIYVCACGLWPAVVCLALF
jgi:hypothetical protein